MSAALVPLPQDTLALTGANAAPTAAAASPRQEASPEAPATAPRKKTEKTALESPGNLLMEEPAQARDGDDDAGWRAAAQRIVRRQTVESLLSLDAALKAGAVKGKAFSEAANTAWTAARRGPDHFTRRMGRLLLCERFAWQDEVEQACIRQGPADFCKRYLGNNYHATLGFSSDRTVHSEKTMVAALHQAAALTPDQDLAMAVAQTVHLFSQRSEKELNAKIRSQESSEQDRNVAAAARQVLEHWQRHDCLEIQGDLHELASNWPIVRPGEPPIVEIRRPSEPPAWPPGSEPIVKELAAWEQHPEELQRGLEGLLVHGAPMVDSVVARATAPHPGRDDVRRLANALQGAREHPELRPMLETHLPELTHHGRNAYAAGRLCTDNLVGGQNARLVDELTRTFPEIVTPEYFRHEVMGLALASEINTANKGVEIAQELWKQRPELRDLAMECAIELPDCRQAFHLDHSVQRLLRAASEDGWVPSEGQQDWLTSWLYVIPGREKQYLRGNDSFTSALKAATHAEPGALATRELPDAQGKMVPLVPALLDQVLRDNDFRDILGTLTGSNPYGRDRSYEDLALVLRDQVDPATNESMLSELETSYRAAGSLAGLNARHQLLLAALALQPGNDARLKKLLVDEQDSETVTFKPLVDRLLRAPVRQQALEGLNGPDLTAAQIVERGAQALRPSLRIGGPEVSQTQARMAELLRSASPVAVREQGQKLLEQLTAELAQLQTGSQASSETHTRLAALTPLLQVDRELRLSSRPLLAQMQRLAETGSRRGLLSEQNRRLGEALMAGQTDVLRATSPDALRPVLEETLQMVEGYGAADLTEVLNAWSERVEARPQSGSGPLDVLENGVVALTNPELRAGWLESYRSGPQDQVAHLIADGFMEQMFASEKELIGQPGLSLEQRAHHLELLESLGQDMYFGLDKDPIGDAFKKHAQDWEAALYDASVDDQARQDLLPLYRAVLSAPGEPPATWALVEPVWRRYDRESRPSVLGAITACRRTDETFPEQFGHFGAISGYLGAEKAAEAAEVFENYQTLREAGQDHETAFNRALGKYLNPGSGEALPARSGVEESDAAVTVGGVTVRKRKN